VYNHNADLFDGNEKNYLKVSKTTPLSDGRNKGMRL